MCKNSKLSVLFDSIFAIIFIYLHIYLYFSDLLLLRLSKHLRKEAGAYCYSYPSEGPELLAASAQLCRKPSSITCMTCSHSHQKRMAKRHMQRWGCTTSNITPLTIQSCSVHSWLSLDWVQFLDCFLLVEYSAWERARGRFRATRHAETKMKKEGSSVFLIPQTQLLFLLIVTVYISKTLRQNKG